MAYSKKMADENKVIRPLVTQWLKEAGYSDYLDFWDRHEVINHVKAKLYMEYPHFSRERAYSTVAHAIRKLRSE